MTKKSVKVQPTCIILTAKVIRLNPAMKHSTILISAARHPYHQKKVSTVDSLHETSLLSDLRPLLPSLTASEDKLHSFLENLPDLLKSGGIGS
jgi:hypothetical protein